ncbi:hypothetical protein H7X46_02620 [Pseudonocardia sp. C8]|uniref:SIS domain-containing protein n=1 Tax=Pseudonocardia sp. C8 TaxID=2762759 RepID=UPI001642E762|nr:hypothetical protein [Pseudonocardia sp. C8]MBC3189956.1 hypothetical protein [Pseudonocardia sp. C8]
MWTEQREQVAAHLLGQFHRLAEEIKASANGVSNVFLVASGGTWAGMISLKYLLDRQSPVPVYHVQAEEFLANVPPLVGRGSLVFVTSYGGTSAGIEAARHCADAGATVLGMAGDASSPLYSICQECVTIDAPIGGFLMDATALVFNLFGYTLLDALNGSNDHAPHLDVVRRSPEVIRHVREEADETARQIAENVADLDIVYLVASGPNYGVAYSGAMCLFEESLWRHASSRQAGEFFHGTLEIVTPDFPILTFIGEDETRPLSERVVRFAERFSPQSLVVDTRDLTLPGVPQDLRAVLSPALLGSIMSRIGEHLASFTGHDLLERRYMWGKEDY